MKVYTSALINKPQRLRNQSLAKNLSTDYRKSLHISKDLVTSQELNTFIVLSGDKNGKSTTIDPKIIDKMEKGSIKNQLSKYYKNNRSQLENYLKKNRELIETSQIVNDFIKKIDSGLSKNFQKKLTEMNETLPETFYTISEKSLITVWDLDTEYRFNLSGFDFPLFCGEKFNTGMNVGSLVDKLIIVNFFNLFLEPTLKQLKKMEKILDRLKEVVIGTHYKTTNEKFQNKSELFFRILVAKISALQEMDNLLHRIFSLFEIPRMLLSQHNLHSDYLDFNTILNRINASIRTGKSLLHSVSDKLTDCQICLRDYLDEQTNGVKLIDSDKEFKGLIFPLAETSVDLFLQAELLKIWTDFFGSDIPYYSFNTQMFSKVEASSKAVDDDVIISARGLFKNYNLGRTTVYALRGLNLDIHKGEFIAILGSSGAGKTTFLNCMAGLDKPDHGYVFFKGEDLHAMNDSRKSKARLYDMGFIFQNYALIPHFNARENVELPADLSGLRDNLKERIHDLLKGVGIDQQENQFPAQLSGGQLQRVAIARALTNNPAVIFADEPTGDLDSVTGKQVMELLKKFHEETETTIIVITHEESIADYATRIIRMEDGIITQR